MDQAAAKTQNTCEDKASDTQCPTTPAEREVKLQTLKVTDQLHEKVAFLGAALTNR